MAPTDDLAFRGTSRFEVRQRLGAGSFGVVYEAYDRERGATVALKTLNWISPDTLLRFKREFRSLVDCGTSCALASCKRSRWS
jgi:serine/threonine protein kinase